MTTKKNNPSWIDVKAKLTNFENADLIGLLQELYTVNKDNQAFLHTRFALGEDILKAYKDTILRWLWPDLSRNQDISVATAKKAIATYKKAAGQPDGLTELMVFYCEMAVGFIDEVGLQHESYFDALVRMFEQALKTIAALPLAAQPAFLARLDRVRHVSHKFGYGIGDEMDDMLTEYGHGG